MHDEKFGISGQLRNKLFLITIHRFPLEKAAMNAAFVNCAMLLTKRLNFFIFQLPKEEQRPLRGIEFLKLR